MDESAPPGRNSKGTQRSWGVPDDAAASLALGWLLSFFTWQEILRDPQVYLAKFPFLSSALLPLVACVFAAAALIFAAVRLGRLWERSIVVRYLGALCLWSILVLVINGLRSYAWTSLGEPGPIPTVLSAVAIAGLAVALLFRPQWTMSRVWRSMRFVFLLFLVSSVAMLQLARRLPPTSAYADKPAAKELPWRTDAPRVVWLVLDELDQYYGFDHRPDFVKMPEFDRWQRSSLTGSRVFSPASDTRFSVPALLTGSVLKVLPLDRIDSEWSRRPNVLGDARKAGFNTSIVGWHLPYGRVLAQDATAVTWEASTMASGEEEFAAEPTFLEAFLRMARGIFAILPRHKDIPAHATWLRTERAKKFGRLRVAALRDAADPRYGLVFLHLPVPHSPSVFDPTHRRIDPSSPRSYFDGLAHADDLLREISEAMRASGVLDRTTLLITSDHRWRVPFWSVTPMWTAQDRQVTGNVEKPLIPFILHLPGQTQPIAYSRTFNTILSRELIMAVLQGRIADGPAAAKWLDEHSDASIVAGAEMAMGN